VKKHIDFDTGPSLFETADEYERLVSSPPSGENLNKKKKVARDTILGSLRLSQVNRGDDPSKSIAGVSFRHLAMLAQIKSNDQDIWDSLNKSKHIDGRPNLALIGRLSRMRNWIDGVHFPENAKINIQEQMNDEDKEKITKEQRRFLSSLLIKLENCPWNESQISQLIRETATESEISPREGYMALYLLIIGRDYGPRIASIIVELGKVETIKIFSKSL
jgi:lysyl-tRNA synthetase class 1